MEDLMGSRRVIFTGRRFFIFEFENFETDKLQRQPSPQERFEMYKHKHDPKAGTRNEQHSSKSEKGKELTTPDRKSGAHLVSIHKWREINEVHLHQNPENRSEGVYWDAFSPPPQLRNYMTELESSHSSQQSQTYEDASPSQIFVIPKEHRALRPIRPIRPQSNRHKGADKNGLMRIGTRSKPKTSASKALPRQTKTNNDEEPQKPQTANTPAESRTTSIQESFGDFDDDFDEDLILASQQVEERESKRMNNNMPETPKVKKTGRKSLGRNLNADMELKSRDDAKTELCDGNESLFESSIIEVEESKNEGMTSFDAFNDEDDEIFSQINC